MSRGPLVVRICNWVGEVVLSVPTLRRLADSGYELELVGKPWAPALLEGLGWPVSVRPAGLRKAVAALRTLRARLGARSAPALLMTKSLSSALEMRLAGYRPSGYAHDGRSILMTHAYDLPRFDHASHAYWNLASRFLVSDVAYPAEIGWNPSVRQTAAALRLIDTQGLAIGRFAVLCPLSGPDDLERRKIWSGFGELAERLARSGIIPVVCPGPGEESNMSASVPGAVQLTDVDLGVYGALQKQALAVIANDTGPGHLAAAVGARLISIYGPQSSTAWVPIGANVQLFRELSGWPSVERVVAAVTSGQ